MRLCAIGLYNEAKPFKRLGGNLEWMTGIATLLRRVGPCRNSENRP